MLYNKVTKGLVSVVLGTLLLLCVSLAYGDLEEVKKAIEANNADWVAGETSVSNLANKDVLLGIASPALEGSTSRFVGSTVPILFDWRDEEIVSSVKNQGNCGSCWAFAGVGALESLLAIRGHPVYDLSEQYLLSCSGGSCNGWWMDRTANFIRDSGTVTELVLPYEATDDVPCPEIEDTFRIDEWSIVVKTDVIPEIIMPALLLSPLVTTMGVYDDFYYYTGGVYSHITGGFIGWHAVLIIGYDASGEYWIAKNSWGTNWGEDGFFRIKWPEGDTYFGEYTQIYLLEDTPAVEFLHCLSTTWASLKQ